MASLDKAADHASKVSFWKKLRKSKSTAFGSVAVLNPTSGTLPPWAENPGLLDVRPSTAQDDLKPPRKFSLYGLGKNPSGDLPTLFVTESTGALHSGTSHSSVPSSKTMPPLRGGPPSSFDMMFNTSNTSSSSSRSRYAFTPPLHRSDTDNALNPKSLFEIRAFANALQRLHNRGSDDSSQSASSNEIYGKEESRRPRTLKSARMRPATSASSADSSSGPFKSTNRFPLTPYPPRAGSVWGLWEPHEHADTHSHSSGGSSPLLSGSAWASSASSSSDLTPSSAATSIQQRPSISGSSTQGDSQLLKPDLDAKWRASTSAPRSPLMVTVKSTAAHSIRGEYDVQAISPRYESFLTLDIKTSDSNAQGDDFAREVQAKLKEIMVE